MEITMEQSDNLVKHLKSEGKESVQSLVPFCSKFTLNIICGKFENKFFFKH